MQESKDKSKSGVSRRAFLKSSAASAVAVAGFGRACAAGSDKIRLGVVGFAVGAPFAVLVAEELFASGCELLISMTSAGQIVAAGPEHRNRHQDGSNKAPQNAHGIPSERVRIRP